MDKKQAIEAMNQGLKVTHQYFSPNEWMTMQDGKIILEDGVKCSPMEFWKWRVGSSWESGYSLWQPKENLKPF